MTLSIPFCKVLTFRAMIMFDILKKYIVRKKKTKMKTLKQTNELN